MSSLGYVAYVVRGAVCVCSLEETDVAKRQVFMLGGNTMLVRAWACAWRNASELVLGIQAHPPESGQPRRFLRTFDSAGLLVADLSRKQVRPIWVAKGIDVRCRFMTWPEWEKQRR